jgi:hypothetical protein
MIPVTCAHAGKREQSIIPFALAWFFLRASETCPAGGSDLSPCEHNDIVLPFCLGIFESAEGANWLGEQFGSGLGVRLLSPTCCRLSVESGILCVYLRELDGKTQKRQ